MLIFGAVDFAGALSEVGRFLGYRFTVRDARPVFATPARFPHADDVVTDRPHRYLPATEVDARTATISSAAEIVAHTHQGSGPGVRCRPRWRPDPNAG